ncbi:MAG: hypothetical protein WC763_04325 [Candidatus Paceibacterota bacterium]
MKTIFGLMSLALFVFVLIVLLTPASVTNDKYRLVSENTGSSDDGYAIGDPQAIDGTFSVVSYRRSWTDSRVESLGVRAGFGAICLASEGIKKGDRLEISSSEVHFYPLGEAGSEKVLMKIAHKRLEVYPK